MSAYNLGRHDEAFQHFSEAIRLSPGNCIYHANRASAALHLGRADVALQDAKNAIKRGDGYCKAYLRGGAAAMVLQRPHEALSMYQQALQLNPGSRAAKAGCGAAAKMAEQQRSVAEQEGGTALCGERPALPLAAPDDEAAAEQLLSAEAMLQACPGLHAAKCAHVEALILCQRYTDAHSACDSLLPGVDKLYLQAQAGWRAGSLKEALAALHGAQALVQNSPKCSQLIDLVAGVMQHDNAAAAAFEEGREEECIEECAAALQLTEHCSCAGLRCRLLYHRGCAHSAVSRHDEALSDCAAALQLNPAHADCLHLRHQVHRDMGNYAEAFLDLQRLRKVAPGWPGLLQLLGETATLSLGNTRNHHVPAVCSSSLLTVLPQGAK
ncbi:g6362 [Coccomyxa elongata]